MGEDYGMEQLLPLVLKTGEINLRCMELLDRANTQVLGTPSPTEGFPYHRKGAVYCDFRP